ncbi:MAG: bacillithiol system redox-active protein YtxJ [Chitinophagaceae bacterium]
MKSVCVQSLDKIGQIKKYDVLILPNHKIISTDMEWNELNSSPQLQEILVKSKDKAQVIFKHSTRCSISRTVWNRLERANELPDGADYYYLDLISHRPVSSEIAELLDVEHESPQILVIKDGRAVYNADHFEITADELAENVK